MRALLQRVLEAKVVVDSEITGQIEHGILVFIGIGKNDNFEIGKKLIDKILNIVFLMMSKAKWDGILAKQMVVCYLFLNLP